MELYNELSFILDSIKEKKPIVHHITNYVTMNDCANVVLAFNGSPIMADYIEEIEEVVSISSSLVLNIGTLNEDRLKSIIKAGKMANEINIPIVLDPVGVGVSNFRKSAVKTILKEVNIAVLKGNMSEIKSIYGLDTVIKGLDSTESPIKGGTKIAKSLANRLNCTVIITGDVDIISNGKEIYYSENGHKQLSKVTGTGCMTSSLVGVCLGTGNNNIFSSILAAMTMGIAGELAYEMNCNKGLGSFKVNLLDSISNLNIKDYIKRGRAYEIKS